MSALQKTTMQASVVRTRTYGSQQRAKSHSAARFRFLKQFTLRTVNMSGYQVVLIMPVICNAFNKAFPFVACSLFTYDEAIKRYALIIQPIWCLVLH